MALPSGSIDTTPSLASLFTAWPEMSRLRVIAGSTVWKKRRCSRRPPQESDNGYGFVRPASRGLEDEFEVEQAKRLTDAADDFPVGIGDAQNPLAIAALGVENPGEESRGPGSGRRRWPCNQLLDSLHRRAGLAPYCLHGCKRGGAESESLRFHVFLLQPPLRLVERLQINESQAELLSRTPASVRSEVQEFAEHSVATNQAA